MKIVICNAGGIESMSITEVFGGKYTYMHT